MNAETIARRYIRVQNRIASELLQVKRGVRQDWVPSIQEVDELVPLILSAIAHKDWRVMVALYAAAIVMDRRQASDGGFPWAEVAKAVQKKYWWVPNVVAILKRDAWRHVFAAKARQTAHGRATRAAAPATMGNARLAAHWHGLGVLVSYSTAIALAIFGGVVTFRLALAIAAWANGAETPAAMRLALDLCKWRF